jgi:hypothetical protein
VHGSIRSAPSAPFGASTYTVSTSGVRVVLAAWHIRVDPPFIVTMIARQGYRAVMRAESRRNLPGADDRWIARNRRITAWP